jgi:hypothetical protein
MWYSVDAADSTSTTKSGDMTFEDIDDFVPWIDLAYGLEQDQFQSVPPSRPLIMVNDLKLDTDLVKFIDDSTTWEVLHRDSQSNLPSAVKACEEWTCDNNMKLNASKTKEMRVNFSSSSPSYSPIVINNQTCTYSQHRYACQANRRYHLE